MVHGMKKYVYLTILLLCMLWFCGCDNKVEPLELKTTAVDVSDFVVMGYSIAYDNTDGSGNFEYAELIRSDFIEKLNISSSDIKITGADSIDYDGNVIIIGGDGCDDFAYNDFKYTVIGNSLRISARTKSGLERGIDYFSEHLIDVDNGKILFPTEDVTVKTEYLKSNFEICGINVADYTIKPTSSKANESAQYLRDYIGNICGAVLEIDKNTDAEHCIVLGESFETPSDGGFIAETDNGVLRINAADLNDLKLAVMLVMYECVTRQNSENINIEFDDIFIYDHSMLSELEAVSIYVSPDATLGGDGSIDNPLSSFKDAALRVREIRSDIPIPVNVYFKGGDYYVSEDDIAKLTENDSGYEYSPIVYSAYNGERVNFIGGTKLDLSKAEKISDNELSNFNSEFKDNIYKIVLPEYVDEVSLYSTLVYQTSGNANIYFNGMAMWSSRYPNKDIENEYVGLGEWLYPSKYYADVKGDSTQGLTFYFDDSSVFDRISGWSENSLSNFYIGGKVQAIWRYDTYTVDKIDTETMALHSPSSKVAYDVYEENVTSKRKCYFYNIPEELDSLGECWLDKDNRTLYFYCDNIDSAEMIYSVVSNVFISLDNVEYVSFKGLNFKYMNDCMLLKYCNNIEISGCTFENGSGRAITFNNSNCCKVDSCHINDMQNGGILVSGAGNISSLEYGEIEISNNVIHDTNRLSQVGTYDITVYDSVGTWIHNNTIYNNPWVSVALGGCFNTFEYNEVYRICTDDDDTTAISWGRTATVIGNVIRYNYFHDIGNEDACWLTSAIYTDDFGTSGEIYGNYFYNTSIMDPEYQYKGPSIMLNQASFAGIHDNIFICTGTEVPTKDTNGITSWLRNTIGAYADGVKIAGFDSIEQYGWRKNLDNIGFYVYNDDGSYEISETWTEALKDTLWESYLTLLNYENYSQVYYQHNGKLYSVESALEAYGSGELSVEDASRVLVYLVIAISNKANISNTNYFNNNLVIGMQSDFSLSYTSDGNSYISYDEANDIFIDPQNGDLHMTENSEKIFAERYLTAIPVEIDEIGSSLTKGE